MLHFLLIHYLSSYTTLHHSVLFELWDLNSNYSMMWKFFCYPSNPHFSSLSLSSFSYVPSEMRDRDCRKYLRDRFIMQNSNLISGIVCSFQNHQASAMFSSCYFYLIQSSTMHIHTLRCIFHECSLVFMDI